MFLRIYIVCSVLMFFTGCQTAKTNKSSVPATNLSEPNESENTDDKNIDPPESTPTSTFSIKGRVTFLSLLFSTATANSDFCLSQCETQRCAHLYVLDKNQNQQ